MKKIIVLMADFLIASALILGIWWYQYLLPKKGIKASVAISNTLKNSTVTENEGTSKQDQNTKK